MNLTFKCLGTTEEIIERESTFVEKKNSLPLPFFQTRGNTQKKQQKVVIATYFLLLNLNQTLT